ncbi:MAG: hypothetical protein ACJAR2_000701 [Ilumatobacter sp.]|jgi:hypothetical protein
MGKGRRRQEFTALEVVIPVDSSDLRAAAEHVSVRYRPVGDDDQVLVCEELGGDGSGVDESSLVDASDTQRRRAREYLNGRKVDSG